ncbi:MAG: hypothetical protein ACREUZ_07245, partial [Burkholderiales bacterium]
MPIDMWGPCRDEENQEEGQLHQVKASVANIMDLPKSKLGVDIENDFAPEYHVIHGKKKIISELKQA